MRDRRLTEPALWGWPCCLNSGQDLEHDTTCQEDRLHQYNNDRDGSSKSQAKLLETQELYNVALERLRCHDYKTYIARVHEEEGKAGRLLARVVRPAVGGMPITQLTTMEGTILHSPIQINTEFMTYYTFLYGPLQGDTSDKKKGFLAALPRSILSETNRDTLVARLSVEEVKV
ncbi:hypothetical protein NDU88_004394 [Pleurodeles waltl]|uniref:Uncharacterized protein n=1 Tax=Pleurodeles waltl TaxID=8319 RepID=A0AAV7W4V4_PLEWA|nr:hypothetical protein NDU88_004394 [Pleurodeles waltl]